VMCDQLQEFLVNLSEEQFKMLQLIHIFFKSPERLLDKMKLYYMGDLKVKERIIRIYVTRSFGSYKITRNIFAITELFEGIDPKEHSELKEAYVRFKATDVFFSGFRLGLQPRLYHLPSKLETDSLN